MELLWNDDIFVFKILLYNNRKVFCSFPVKEHQRALGEGIGCFHVGQGIYLNFPV